VSGAAVAARAALSASFTSESMGWSECQIEFRLLQSNDTMPHGLRYSSGWSAVDAHVWMMVLLDVL